MVGARGTSDQAAVEAGLVVAWSWNAALLVLHDNTALVPEQAMDSNGVATTVMFTSADTELTRPSLTIN